eukprot:5377020-Lingulodinium_polyedra.AAC.1
MVPHKRLFSAIAAPTNGSVSCFTMSSFLASHCNFASVTSAKCNRSRNRACARRGNIGRAGSPNSYGARLASTNP